MTQHLKRTLSLVLAILLSLTLFPGLAFADEDPAAPTEDSQVAELPADEPEKSIPAEAPEELSETEAPPEEPVDANEASPEEFIADTDILAEEISAPAAAASVETPAPASNAETDSPGAAGSAAPAGEDPLPSETPTVTAAPKESPTPATPTPAPTPSPTPSPAVTQYALATPSVKSVSNTEAGIKITWGAVKGAAKYRVFRRVGETGKWKKVGDTTGTYLTDKKAEAGVTYTYTVRCISSNGKKYTSDYVTGPTITRLTAVKLTKAACAAEGVKVTWKALSGAEGYYVYRKTSSSSWKKVGTVKSGTILSYTDTSAKSGTSYTYTVRAYANGYKGLYDAAGVSVSYIAAPALSSLSNVEGGVKLVWDAVKGADNYRVFRRIGNGSWKKLGDTTSTSYIDKTAQEGVDYTYTVRCISSNGKKYVSAYRSGKDIRYLPAPTLSRLTAIEEGMEIRWAAVSGAEEYIVYRKSSGASWTQIATVGSDTTAYTDATAPGGTVCAYTVRAKAQGQLSGYDKTGLLPSGWIEFDGKTYNIKDDSTRTTGWVKKDGHKYYFNSDGTIATGWLSINDTWYYFYKKNDKNGDGGPYGAMATNVIIDNWQLKSNGKGVSMVKVNMTNKAQSYYSSTSWLILVDTKNCVTGVFKGSQGNWTLKYYWNCAPGKDSTPTVLGTFTVKEKGYYFDSGSARCYYYTQFYGNYLFHSTLYYHDGTSMDSRVGQRLSHGCVRLEISNAKWIYNNIPRGTKVVVYY